MIELSGAARFGWFHHGWFWLHRFSHSVKENSTQLLTDTIGVSIHKYLCISCHPLYYLLINKSRIKSIYCSVDNFTSKMPLILL